jgi:hypothetical protein
MKLFVWDKISGTKIYLNILASTRSELAKIIGSTWFSLHGQQYHVHEVIAETDSNSTVAGALIGGLIGVLGGPIGVLIGGALGGALGNENDKTEIYKVSRFNQSRV